jgi:hypothetical protein
MSDSIFGQVTIPAWRRRLLELHPATVRQGLWAAPVLAVVSLFYVFAASAGWFRDLPTETDYYNRLAEGFRHGHLYFDELPSPTLLAKPNPFASENAGLWLWDASLYKGHYYMYWGPVPGLLLLAFKTLTSSHDRISDQWPTTLFTLGRLYAGALLILSLASRARLRQPAWLTTLAIAVFGLSNPVPFIVARPHMYEACLSGSQCFLFAALCSIFWALELPRVRRALFWLTGVLLALALGCRATSFLAVPSLGILAWIFAWRRGDRWLKTSLLDGLGLAVPVGIAVVAYGLYNAARFDSITEFGIHYQVTLQPFFGRPEYVSANVFSYLFAPLHGLCRFPFVNMRGERSPPLGLHWPPGYFTFEPVAGLLVTAPWCGLAVLAIWRVVAYAFAWLRGAWLSPALLVSTHEAWGLSCSAVWMLSMIPALGLWEASMRYLGDAIGGIVLAATFGVFASLGRIHPERRASGRRARGSIVALGLYTCAVGVLCAFGSYDDPLRKYNAPLLHRLEQSGSFCNASP